MQKGLGICVVPFIPVRNLGFITVYRSPLSGHSIFANFSSKCINDLK